MADRFRFDSDGNIVGPGLFIPRNDQIAPGVIGMDLEMLNKLYELGVQEGRIGVDDGAKIRSARIQSAKESLIEDLGIDPALVK